MLPTHAAKANVDLWLKVLNPDLYGVDCSVHELVRRRVVEYERGDFSVHARHVFQIAVTMRIRQRTAVKDFICLEGAMSEPE